MQIVCLPQDFLTHHSFTTYLYARVSIKKSSTVEILVLN